MLFRLSFLLVFLIVSCSSSKRPDIVFEDFESGNFGKWNKLGVAFDKPSRIDSVSEKIKNAQGTFFAFPILKGRAKVIIKVSWSQKTSLLSGSIFVYWLLEVNMIHGNVLI